MCNVLSYKHRLLVIPTKCMVFTKINIYHCYTRIYLSAHRHPQLEKYVSQSSTYKYT